VSTGGELVLQRAVRAVARAALKRGDGNRIDTPSLRRILVVRTDDRVGNVLLTTPLLRALREGLPHVRIDWLVAARRRPLVEGLFLADRLVPYDKRRAARNPVGFSSFLVKLRASGYDAVLDAAHFDAFSLTAAMFTRWTGAPVRIGHDRGDAAHFYSHAVPVPEDTRYDVAVKLGLLAPLGLAPRGYELETSAGTSAEGVGDAEALLGERKLAPHGFFTVNPGARKLDRRVAPERLAQVVQKVSAATGLRALVVWGPGEEALAAEVVDAARNAAVLAPPTDLHLLAAVLRRTALLVTNDTGPMHLGVACGAPVLALFTVADSARWGHPLPTFEAIEGADEHPDLATEAAGAAERLLDAARKNR
jgi:heptosyltransferase-3